MVNYYRTLDNKFFRKKMNSMIKIKINIKWYSIKIKIDMILIHKNKFKMNNFDSR